MTFEKEEVLSADLKIFSTNKAEGEPPTILIIEGFVNQEAINYFIDMLFESGIFQVDRRTSN